MALVSSITGQKTVQLIQSATGTVIKLDCSLREKHTRESPATQFPVEKGDTVSDNILIKPFSLEIQGIISDTPLSLRNAILTTAVSAFVPPIGIVAAGAGVALFKAIAGSSSPSVTAYAQLLKLQESKAPFDVLTSLKRYTNMWISGLSVPRDSQTGQALVFDLSLVELILVAPQSVNIQIFSNPNVSAKSANLGKQELQNPVVQSFKQGQAFTRSVLGGG